MKDNNFSKVLGSLYMNEYIRSVSKYSTFGSIIETYSNIYIVKDYSYKESSLRNCC